MKRAVLLSAFVSVLVLGGHAWPQSLSSRIKTLPRPVPLAEAGPASAATMDDLRGLVPGASAWLMLFGYHAPGDGGGGAFFWDAASTAPDDVGTVIVPDANPPEGRWRRVESSPLSVRWFGAIGDGSSHPLSEFFPTLADAQARYPHAVDFGDEIDWAAIQSALDGLPGIAIGKGGGVVEIPAGDYRVSRPIELTAPNTALHGEVNAATTLTWSVSGQWSGPFTFVRSSLDTLTQTLFRIQVKDLFFDAGTNPPTDMIGLDVTGMSFSVFGNLTMQFRSNDCTGVFGTAPSGAAPYYNLFTNVSVFGPSGPFESNGCRGYWFTGDPSLGPSHPKARFAPNANNILGGYLAGLEYGYDDSGTGNSVFGLIIESVRVGYELGEDAVGAYVGYEGATNNTTIIGPYLEDGGPNSTALNIRETAGSVKFITGYRTGYENQILDAGVSTTLLPGGNFASSQRGILGGHIDMRGDTLNLKNTGNSLIIETELSSFAFEPAILLNQKHANDVRIVNQSAFASSATLRVDNLTGGNEMFRVSGQGDLRTEGDVEVGNDLLFTGGPGILQGAGVPTAFAPNGSLYLRTGGGEGPALFVRENGAWVPK